MQVGRQTNQGQLRLSADLPAPQKLLQPQSYEAYRQPATLQAIAAGSAAAQPTDLPGAMSGRGEAESWLLAPLCNREHPKRQV